MAGDHCEPYAPAQHTTAAALVVIKLEAHAVVDLVVLERDVVLVDRVPLLRTRRALVKIVCARCTARSACLDAKLLSLRTTLRRKQLLQIAHRILRVALDANLLAEPIVTDHLDHDVEAGGGGGE